jgi:tetratricopeptide (TPR) repeat protein
VIGALLAAGLLGGCGGPAPRTVGADAVRDALPDSVSLQAFMDLPDEARAARRLRAEEWRRQALRQDATPDRVNVLNRAVGLAPDHAQAWLDLAEIWSWAGGHLQADACLDAAAAAIRRFNDADYDRAVGIDERDAAARRTALLRAWLHYGRAEWREGLDWAKAAVQLDPGDEHSLRIRGLLDAALGNRSQAHEAADELHRLDMHDPSGNWIMAMLDRSQGHYRQAYNFVKDRRPEPSRAAECWRDMGLIAEQLGEWSEAERWYAESHAALPLKRTQVLKEVEWRRLGPPTEDRRLPVWLAYDRYYVTGSLSAYTSLALDRFHAAADEEARTLWGGIVVNAAGVLLRRAEEQAWALRARGLVFVAQDRTDRGLEDLRQAAVRLGRQAERDARLQAGLGHAWLAKRRQDRALPHLQRAVRLDTGLATAWSDLGLTLVMTGEPEDAREAFARALDHDATLVTAWYNRGLLNLHDDRLEEAEADLARAAALAPSNQEIGQLLQQVRQRLR